MSRDSNCKIDINLPCKDQYSNTLWLFTELVIYYAYLYQYKYLQQPM